MRVVAALGGNALLQRGQPVDLATQLRNVEIAARAVATLAAEHEVAVVHGNGPQVGLLALQAESCQEVPAYPLDVLGAESEGMIGYLIEQALRRELPSREIATLLTQVEVKTDDPAFNEPSKPIGPVYPLADAWKLQRERGWTLVREGNAWRRVVASPAPLRIVELATLRRLLEAGVLVIGAGGGGIPVAVDDDGCFGGVDAVVDKDRTAALLARELKADRLLLLTDVPCVYRDWPAKREPIHTASPSELCSLHFEAGSMGPKVEAACDFASRTPGTAVIGALGDASEMIRGCAGTQITREPPDVRDG